MSDAEDDSEVMKVEDMSAKANEGGGSTPSKTRAAAARPRLPSPPPVRAFIDVTVRMTDIPRAPARESYAHT